MVVDRILVILALDSTCTYAFTYATCTYFSRFPVIERPARCLARVGACRSGMVREIVLSLEGCVSGSKAPRGTFVLSAGVSRSGRDPQSDAAQFAKAMAAAVVDKVGGALSSRHFCVRSAHYVGSVVSVRAMAGAPPPRGKRAARGPRRRRGGPTAPPVTGRDNP